MFYFRLIFSPLLFLKEMGSSAAYSRVLAQRTILVTVVHFFCVLNHFVVLFENLIPLHIPFLLYNQCWIVSDSKRKKDTHTHLCIYKYIWK